MRYAPRPNRYERRQMHAVKLASDMGGTGIYVFENNTDGDLKLPKATVGGLKTVGPRKRFQGDSYFLKWVGSPMNLLRLIEEIVPKMTTQEISDKIAEMLTPDDTNAEVKIIYQTVADLHKACPKNLGDWYFTGDYPTDGGNRVVNRAFMNFYEGKDARAY